MNMPGFTAAAALSKAGGGHQALSKFADLEVDKVLPQKEPQTICGHGSGKYFCWYTCCTITYIGKYNVPVMNCSTENICAHPGQGVFR
jgi:hypothetical protein